jgi:hypothetical protein
MHLMHADTIGPRDRIVLEIAVRFGVAESTIMKRLALGRVSPVILEADPNRTSRFGCTN